MLGADNRTYINTHKSTDTLTPTQVYIVEYYKIQGTENMS